MDTVVDTAEGYMLPRRTSVDTIAADSQHSNTETAIRRTLAVLERASDSWRNGSPSDDGPVHWPVAIHFARQELHAALVALSNGAQAEDARGGIAWWNELTPPERAYWLQQAQSAVPADAWRAFQRAAP